MNSTVRSTSLAVPCAPPQTWWIMMSRVRQGEALALGAGGEKHRAHAGGHADAVGVHVAGEELHRVVDREAGGDGAAGAVDVNVDVLLRVLHLEEEELGDDELATWSSIGVPMKMMRSLSRRE